MLNIPWYGWVALAVGALIVASMIASEVIEDRELRRRGEDLEESGDETDEIASPVADAQEPPAEHADAAAAATSERRVPRFEPLPSVAEVIETAIGEHAPAAENTPARKRQRKPAKPRSRKKAPARKAKKRRKVSR